MLDGQSHLQEDALLDAFDRIDSDDSGFISFENLRDLLGRQFSPTLVQQMIADYLFLDIGNNPFATEKRSLRSNHADLNQNLTFSEVHDLRGADTTNDDDEQQKNLLYENYSLQD